MNLKNRSSERFFFTSYSMNPHLLSVSDLTISDVYQLFNQANLFKTLKTDSIEKVLHGKTVVLAFFESSTRTRISNLKLIKHVSLYVSNASVKKGI